jgi:hypothetical protein
MFIKRGAHKTPNLCRFSKYCGKSSLEVRHIQTALAQTNDSSYQQLIQ